MPITYRGLPSGRPAVHCDTTLQQGGVAGREAGLLPWMPWHYVPCKPRHPAVAATSSSNLLPRHAHT